ncbi:polysaccharide deacetylase family protein [Sporosarcina sp. FSL K6-1508]|uniref:polysaccharide deacetylase family protein n=1 Tax=Sporosarcina sp. FSL K6-1508 TaxID=2921553 RepID=UPI0030FB09AB
MKTWEMNKTLFRLLVFITFCTLISFSAAILAATQEPKVLVIYTSEGDEINEYTRNLDMLIGHFTTDITVKRSDAIKKKDLQGVTHLIYYGHVAEKLPASYHELFDDFTGYFVAFGYNSEHLGDAFSFINPLHEVKIDQLFQVNNTAKKQSITAEYAIDIEVAKGSEVLMQGKMTNEAKSYPIAVKNNNKYYFALDDLSSPKLVIIGELFHEVFQSDHEATHPAYIRLEDIHPLVDPQNMKEITDILKEKNIPFMMAIIPMYTNPETGKKYNFSDSPKLLKVLKEAQKNGGSIVLHGYTHQYRESETGEGFEFWDVKSNTPIYADVGEKFVLKTESEFATLAQYEQYMKKLVAFESDYIRLKVTKGIQELTNFGLYPLAFEAPHYTMSQNGYKILSEHFSTYVGQVQLSDKDWEIMGSTPYMTHPSFLNGMQLLPETMGYIQPEYTKALQKMMDQAANYQLTKDGMLSAFYHPYLGVERFKELIAEMEKLPGISWIDLKQMDVWVKAENVDIHTADGVTITNVSRSGLLLSSIDFSAYHFQRFIEVIVWIIAVVGGMAVIMFIGFTVFMSTRKVKVEG